jgi:LDH2 family malate/lactate/ureidoglycolate dehydrogenase
MKEAAPGRIHLTVPEARELGEGALRGMGFAADEAKVVSDHVIDAALCGYEYSGLAKLLNVAETPRFAKPRSPMRIVRETTVSALYDGGNNVGMLTVYHATLDAIRRAKAHGFALVGVTNSWTSGRGAYYVEMMAREGLIGIQTVSASRRVAPFGGRKPALGTNPIALGFPTAGDPLLIDMGTSAFMASDVKVRERAGTPLPEGVALDKDGRPTTDPGAAHRGAILPFGGYKGFGLALAARALGVLCGPMLDLEKIYGFLMISIKPDLLVPESEYRAQLSEAIREIKATPRQDGVDEIRIPGERSQRERGERLRDGIEIDRATFDALTVHARRRS